MSPSGNETGIARMQGGGIDSTQILDSLPDGITVQVIEIKFIYQNKAMVDLSL